VLESPAKVSALPDCCLQVSLFFTATSICFQVPVQNFTIYPPTYVVSISICSVSIEDFALQRCALISAARNYLTVDFRRWYIWNKAYLYRFFGIDHAWMVSRTRPKAPRIVLEKS
jgi:hypothetical protein